MRTSAFTLASLCFLLCSCSQNGPRLPMGDDPSWISDKQALGLCQDSLQQNGYTNTEITGELAAHRKMHIQLSHEWH
jgi:hypothetical protein